MLRLLALASLVALATACPRVCTEASCGSEIATLVSLPADFDATRFELVVERSGPGSNPVRFDCTKAERFECTPAIEAGVAPIDHGEGERLRVDTLGDTPETAATLRFEVHNPGGQVASASFEPDWFEVHPNGPDCPPHCWQASVVELMLELDAG